MVRLDVFDKPATCEAMMGIEEETEYGIGGKAIVENVVVGDNVVMPCESGNGEHFWLLLCDKPIRIVVETFNDPYKNTYYEEVCIICGCYYDLL
jgi:hypothetical protein